MPELVPSPSPYGEIPLDTSRAPQSRVSGGQIAQSYGELAQGEKALGAGAMDLATPLAEAQAASDLQNQKVTLGPDGKVQVMNPARSLIFGRAGEAYGDAVVKGTASSIETQVDQQLAKIHLAHLGDPDGQAAANQSFLAGLKGATGNPLVDQMVSERAADAASRHYVSNLDSTTKLNLDNQNKGLTASITSLQEDLAGMARKGMTAGNPDYDKSMAELNRKWDEKQSNPLLKDPPELVALQKKQFDLRLMGEQLNGTLPGLIDSQGMNVARQKVHDMLDNAALEPSTRARLKFEANQILADATPKWREENRGFDVTVANLTKDFAAHKGTGPQQLNAWGQDKSPGGGQAWGVNLIEAMRLGRERGYEREPELEALAASAPWLKSISQLSPDQRKAIATPYTPEAVEPTAPAAAPAAAVGPKVGQMSPSGGPYVLSGGKIYPTDKDGKIGDKPVEAAPATPALTEPGRGPGHWEYLNDEAHSPVWVPDKPAATPAAATSGETPKAEPAAVTTGTSETAAAAKHGAFVGALVQAESSGQNIYSRTDPDVAGPGTRSQGYFQINTPTWLDFARKAGVDTTKYPNAMSAPYDVQAQVASVIPVTRFGPRTRAILHGKFGQFDDHTTVGELDARYGGSSGTPTGGAPSDATGGFTHEQIRANPWLLAVQTMGMDKDPTEKMAYFDALLKTNTELMKLGQLPNPTQWAEIERIHSDNAGDARYESKYAEAAGWFGAVGAEGMPAAQRAEFDRQTQEASANLGGDPWTRAVAVAAQNHVRELDKNWDEHPQEMAARTGMIPRAAVPLNLSDPRSLAQSLVERNAISEAIGARRGGVVPPAFDKGGDDVNAVKNFLQNAQPADKAAFFGMLANTLDEPVLHSTMRLLGGDNPKDMAQAAAGTLMKDAPGIGESVIRGLSAMQNERFDAEKQDKQSFYEDLDKALPPTMFDAVGRTAATGPYNVLVTMVKARYADIAAGSNKSGYNSEALKNAVDDVTGGVRTFNGGQVIAPTRGMPQADFDGIMRNLTDADLKGAHTMTGEPITADMVKRNGRLESAGDGKYHVMFAGQSWDNPVYAFSAGGNVEHFTLDLTSKAPPPPELMVPGHPELGYRPSPPAGDRAPAPIAMPGTVETGFQ